MKDAPLRLLRQSFVLGISTFCLAFAVVLSTSCGSNSPETQSQRFSGNTQVNVVLTSDANAQLTEFDLEIQKLTLENQAGQTVTLLSNQQASEYIHVNGGIDPLTNVSVPEGIYTSATATIGGAQFTCVTLTPATSSAPGSIDTSTFAYGYTPQSQVTVNLLTPLTITGNSMLLELDLQVLESASYSTCYDPNGGIYTYSIDPTFNLLALPTNNEDKISGMEATISAIGTENTFTLSVAEGPYGTRTLSASSDSSTVFQGITDASALAVGNFVDIDGALQSDGSVKLTRIAMEDPTAVNVMNGPLLQVGLNSILMQYGRLEQGQLLTLSPGGPAEYVGPLYFEFSNAVFQISGQQSNLQTLPFQASFTAQNMVPGQVVDITSPAFLTMGGTYTPANTVTLVPQTIDAQVLGSFTSGNFTVYETALASYDVFPTFAVQPGQATLLTNPSMVDVYVDNSTKLLNKQPLASGSTYRFYGLVFNDNGTLRMDCAQVNDGVPFTAPETPASRMKAGTTHVVRQQGKSEMRQVVNTRITSQ